MAMIWVLSALSLWGAADQNQIDFNAAKIDAIVAYVRSSPTQNSNHRKRKTFTISEEELNSYLKSHIALREKRDLKSFTIRLPEKNILRASVVASIDLSKVFGKNKLFANGLNVQQSFELEALCVCAKSKDSFKSIPLSLMGLACPKP